MSADPEAPAVEPDTPTHTPAADTPPEPEIDYAKRYADLQPEYTRATQTLSDEERLLAHIQEKFPHLIAEADDDDEGDYQPDYNDDTDTPTQVADPRVDELASKLEAIEAKERAEQFENDFKAASGDREVPKQGREWIEYQVFTNGNDKAALENAVKAWFEFEDERFQAKRERPRAPHVPTGGNPVEPEPPKTHQDRVQRALERIQAEQA